MKPAQLLAKGKRAARRRREGIGGNVLIHLKLGWFPVGWVEE